MSASTLSLVRGIVALAFTAVVASGSPAFPAEKKAGKAAAATTGPMVDKSLLAGLEWRSIGPYRGGGSVAVAGVSSQYEGSLPLSPGRCEGWGFRGGISSSGKERSRREEGDRV